MKDEKKVIYLLKLVSSKYKKVNPIAKLLVFDSGGTKSDFEKICCVNQKHFLFRLWLSELIEKNILEENGIIGRYVVNGGKAMEEIKRITGERAFKLIRNYEVDGFI